MDVTFSCPHCSQSLEAPEEAVGEYIRCPSCGRLISITPPPPPAPPAAPVPTASAVVAPPPSVPTVTLLPPAPTRTSGMAVASMVLGILGLVGGWMCCGIVLPILAVTLGHVAYSQIAKRPTAIDGKGFAIAGFTTGYVGLLFGIYASLVVGAWAASVTAMLEIMRRMFEQAMGMPR